MSYPSVNFKHSGQQMGMQPISETSATQKHPLGTIATATDVTFGVGRFVYCVGVASTTAGDVCTLDFKNGDTARAVHGGATSTGSAGVAMSDNVAAQYGWYQIEGAGPIAAATVAADAPLYLTSTAGTLDDAVVAGDKVDGIVARSATSGGFATCQIDHPSITSESSASSVATLLGFLQIALSAATEAGDAIVVTGQVKDLSGTNVSAARQVLVRTLAITDGKGDISVTAGTSKKVVNPATGENVAWIETTAGGAFAVSVANDQAEGTLVQVSTESGVTAALKLTFA